MHRRHVYRVLVALLVVLIALAAGTTAWLARHPLDLAFLTPRIEEALSLADGSLEVEIERTTLVWHGRHGPEIRLRGMRVLTARAGEVARLPEITVDFAARQLLRGRVAVTGLEIESPAARVMREADGRIGIRMRDSEESTDPRQGAIGSLLGQLGGETDPSEPLGMLERVRVQGADLEFEDRALGLVWRAPRADLEVRRRPDGLEGSVDADLEIDGSPGQVAAQIRWVRGANEATSALRVASIDLRPILRTLLASQVPEPLPPLRVDGSIESEWRLGESPLPVAARFDLTHHPGSSTHEALGLSGSLTEVGDAVRLEIEARLPRFDVSDLGAYWPAELADKARRWVVSNIPSGHLADGRLTIAGRFERSDPSRFELESLEGSFEADHLVVRYLDPLPEARDVRTSVSFDRDHWSFELQGGRVRDVAVTAGDVALSGLSGPDQEVGIRAQLEAPISSVAAILAMPPLELASDLDPERYRGRADAMLELSFPLSQRIELSQVELRAEGDLRDVEIADTLAGVTFSGDDLHFHVTKRDLALSGEARLNSAPVRFEGRREFSDERGLQRYEVSGELIGGEPWRQPLDFEITASRDPTRWRRGRARFDPGEDRETHVSYSAEAEGRQLAIWSPDLGSLIAALGWSDRLRGGRLRVDGAGAGFDAPLAGDFELVEFTLAETKGIARVLEALSLQHIRKALAQEGLAWGSFQGGFRFADGLLEIREARGTGPALAFSADGRLQIDAREIDVAGAVVPLRMEELNVLVRTVPVLGRVVMGKDRTLYAANYRVRGPIADPSVDVDPWSALVPDPLEELIGAGVRGARRVKPGARN